MKRLLSLFLCLFMLLSMAACAKDPGTVTDPQQPEPQQTEPQETDSPEITQPSSTEPEGQLVETSRWSLRYDSEVWVMEEEDDLEDTDYSSELTIIIPDPENEDDELVWLRVRAMVTDHNNFRSNLLDAGLDQYEYAVNNAYETVNVGGLEFLLDDSDSTYTHYFMRVFSAGVDVELMISGDVEHAAVADVLDTLSFNVPEGDNVDPPWFWEGTPYAVDPGEVEVGSFTLSSVQIPFAENIVTHETFKHNVAAVGDTVYIISSNVPSSYTYDGTTLTRIGEFDLGKNYEYVEPAADGGVWCSYLSSPLVKWNGSEIVASYDNVKNVAIHPDGTWGLSWFTGSNPTKLTFAEGVMTAEEVELSDVKSISNARIDANGYLYACGSAASGDGHKVFVYNEQLELQAVLADDDGSGLGSVTFAVSTENGFLVVDGNMREIILYTKDGTYIGACRLNDLCGTDYPWPCDGTITADGSILLVMTDERPDQSADELVAFKLTGF